MTTTSAPGSVPSPELAERIGPYRLLQVLGEGGMGIVYEAEETEPVRRRVALKVVRDRHASKEVIARFEVERQALAVMNHPGIAKVFSAGTTESGQPYFAMELVRGLPITQYCDERRLSVRRRLELFTAVCHAVQHAHQKGVIHRDLKPSNILVTEADGVPEPRVIDFGIAKALGQQLTDLTLVTQFGHAMGTAAYMSPEQAESANVDVDTRADIYSLGVMLYEMLVGHLPLDPASVGIHVYIARLVAREGAPPTPSVRLGTGGSDSGIVAKARGTDPEHLRRALKGDLDWIVMKAMDPDRSRRYQTTNALAMDIQRHLRDEPVVARPPSTTYRIGKFVRRHRAATIVAATAVVLVTASSVLTTIGMIRATRAEARAEQEATIAREAAAFLGDLFRPVVSGGGGSGSPVTAREVLDRGVARARSLNDRPALQGLLLHELGVAYSLLGSYEQARPVLEAALDARRRTPGISDTLIAATLDQMGNVAGRLGDHAPADSLFARALEYRRAAAPAGGGNLRPTLSGIAQLRMRQGRYAEAESLYRVVITSHEADGARVPRLFARDLIGLASVYLMQKRMAEAEPIMRRALELQEAALGPEHIDVAGTLNNLGVLYWSLGQYDRALPLYLRTRRIFERGLPPEHPHVASSYNNLGETYWKLRQFEEAEPLLRRALEMKEASLGPVHPSVAVTLNALAGLLRDQARHAEAEPLYRRALAIRERSLPPGDAAILETRRDYAVLLRATGRAAQAAAVERR